MTLEQSHLYWGSFVLWGIFTFFLWLGLKRYFYVDEEKIMICGILKRNRSEIFLSAVTEIQIDQRSILIVTEEKNYHLLLGKKGRQNLLQGEKENPAFSSKVRFVDKIKIELN